MAAVLIDTSSWIQALRRSGDSSIRRRVENLLVEGVAVSTEIVFVELWHGVRQEKEADKLRDLQHALPILTPRASTWKTAYAVARKAHAAGFILPSTDIIIASVAIDYGVTLEHNDKHYEQLQQSLVQEFSLKLYT